ncbi:hypothetical protein CFter6_3789 [Collimonas fungivorans]|uniref:Uncharacterized protein n=1 Tax=Collimonas fungivorans TaxID=158899 RepID=A0A127PG69_9BURK|nr:hypothetical protein CFter6_3789 [Collimonas fungivorans]
MIRLIFLWMQKMHSYVGWARFCAHAEVLQRGHKSVPTLLLGWPCVIASPIPTEKSEEPKK